MVQKRELTSLVKILSTSVAVSQVILVGLLIKGKNEYENKQFTKLAVGAWDSYFNRSILKSPAI